MIWQNITISKYSSEFALFCFTLFNFHNSTLLLYVPQTLCVKLNIMKIFVNDFNPMAKIPLSYIQFHFCQQITFLSTNYIFLTIVLNYDSVFQTNDLHSYSISLRVFCPCRVSFSFPLPILFHFIFFFLISHLPFFLSLFSSFFFSFSNLHHFLKLVRHFLRAPLPCSRTFCCPAFWYRCAARRAANVGLKKG